jgi:hypothetical protein
MLPLRSSTGISVANTSLCASLSSVLGSIEMFLMMISSVDNNFANFGLLMWSGKILDSADIMPII